MKKSSELHDISIDQISSSKLSHKYPYFNVPKNFEAILEKKAGTLFIENIILDPSQSSSLLDSNLSSIIISKIDGTKMICSEIYPNY